jgi:hypothetical protein
VHKEVSIISEVSWILMLFISLYGVTAIKAIARSVETLSESIAAKFENHEKRIRGLEDEKP